MLLIARGVNKRFKAPAGAAIQVVHRQALGRGTGVAVVSVGTRVLVLGTTEGQVTLLTEVEPDEVGLAPETMIPVGTEPELDPETGEEIVPAARPSRPRLPLPEGALAGSVLSAATWKQTLAAFTGQKSP
jgi:flagellar protein FliO/FliZ